MKKIISLILAALLLFTLVGCNQNEKMDEMAQRIAQLEQTLQNQADVNDELNELILTQQGVIDKQQTQIGRAEEAIDNLLGKPIEFTESAPVYGPREGEVELKSFRETFTLGEGSVSSMEHFNSYYETEFREMFDEEFYFLYPEDYVDIPSHLIYAYAEENDDAYVNPMIRQVFYVHDVAQKEYAHHRLEGFDVYITSVYFDVYLAPSPEFVYELDFSMHLWLFFGQDKVGEEEITYFNIYLGGDFDLVCIGTCYYEAKTTLTTRWYEKYFMQNLFKLGDKE